MRRVSLAKGNSEDTIKLELAKERPEYILSSFAAAKHEPNLIFGHDLCPDELRWKYYQAKEQGKVQDYVSYLLAAYRISS